ncbi:hypothetical protein FGG08_004875 [Glutinoglossum americanum]|uniref:Uncharacterized protein n=1 Tax=Glutinoglossum americanum TaxID=1670608 RepID=A0A9P8I4E0_9PEZI|nr:hypothetical protein FGG08_004875 [Glutinoglossum americanum]
MTFSAPKTTLPRPEAMLRDLDELSKLSQAVLHQPTYTSTTCDGNGRPTQYHNTASTLPALKGYKPTPARQQTKAAISEHSSTQAQMRPHRPHSAAALAEPAGTQTATLKYHSTPRPWREARHPANMSTISQANPSPMERWEREGIRDQPWNGVIGVYVEDNNFGKW